MTIDKVWVVLSYDASEPPYTEGIVGFAGPNGAGQLMVGKPQYLPVLEREARKLARATGRNFKIVEFSLPTVVMDIVGGH